MNRRSVLSLLATLPLAPTAFATLVDAEPQDALRQAWEAWKTQHLDTNGRVVDRLQKDASHSEGQGYGMVLAERMNDPEAFEAMFRWAEQNLAVRPDALLAWRWLPDAPIPVPDTNNASDGDLFYAWALMGAAARFDRPEYMVRATAIARDLDALCVVDFPGHAGAYLFLPGASGFETENGFVINPSYYMLRAREELAQAAGTPRLAGAAANGDVLLAEIARHGPVPDWLTVSSDGLHRPAEFSANSGYEALRVPLWMAWSGKFGHPVVTNAAGSGFSTRTAGDGAVATVIDYDSGEVLETSSDAGYRAIIALAACAGGAEPGSAMPPFDPGQSYYPATLHLFSYLAQLEMAPQCFPV
ncbi:glycosyl hydrolase family 8 [Palleronia sp.]|uniref:glycosyl hydrolase family 8 n=1 Tax=Palleronia sp. TaxID=1940284 RepID=UPI0035C80657